MVNATTRIPVPLSLARTDRLWVPEWSRTEPSQLSSTATGPPAAVVVVVGAVVVVELVEVVVEPVVVVGAVVVELVVELVVVELEVVVDPDVEVDGVVVVVDPVEVVVPGGGLGGAGAVVVVDVVVVPGGGDGGGLVVVVGAGLVVVVVAGVVVEASAEVVVVALVDDVGATVVVEASVVVVDAAPAPAPRVGGNVTTTVELLRPVVDVVVCSKRSSGPGSVRASTASTGAVGWWGPGSWMPITAAIAGSTVAAATLTPVATDAEATLAPTLPMGADDTLPSTGRFDSHVSGPRTRRSPPRDTLRKARTTTGSKCVPAQRVSSARASAGSCGFL
jgi:hypothetical protein